MLNTIRRAGTLLTLFTEQRPDWGVREVAAQLGMPRSNVHELMSSLATIGLLQRTPDARYRLGWRLLTLSGHLVNSTDVARVGLPVLHHLAEEHSRAVNIATYDSGQIVSLGLVAPRSTAAVPRIGERLPAHCTASGKIMLAHRSVELDREVTLERLTARTITDPVLLCRQLAQVRREDLAVDRRETHDSVVCVASPIRDGRSGAVIAALSLRATPADFTSKHAEYAHAVRRGAARISALLSQEAQLAECPAGSEALGYLAGRPAEEATEGAPGAPPANPDRTRRDASA
ncbi:MAG TPA: IclR family transcriptional regulator [Pseudonocardia sp.]